MINALLVRWGGGWAEVRDDTAIAADRRREALLGLGAVQSVPEMQRVAQRQLAIFVDVRTEIAGDLGPRDETDTPYLAFGLGDTVPVPDHTGAAVRERVIGMTVAEDDNGALSYAPTFKDVIRNQAERWQETLTKMSAGTIGGESKVATPASSISTTTAKDCCPPATETKFGE